MARDHGYALADWIPDDSNQIESIVAGTVKNTGIEALHSLLNSSTHRPHLLATHEFFALSREVGVGHGYSAGSYYSHYWAAQTGFVDKADTFLTGVVFADANGNRRYDPGEGLSGVTVTAGELTTATNAAGGWSLQVGDPTGSYIVTASGGAFAGTGIAEVQLAGQNVEVDFVSGLAGSYVNFAPYTPPPDPCP